MLQKKPKDQNTSSEKAGQSFELLDLNLCLHRNNKQTEIQYDTEKGFLADMFKKREVSIEIIIYKKKNHNHFGHDLIIVRQFWSLRYNPQWILEFLAWWSLEVQKGQEREKIFFFFFMKALHPENGVIQ